MTEAALYTPATLARIRAGASAADLGWTLSAMHAFAISTGSSGDRMSLYPQKPCAAA
jgi:hypothetical protein